MAGDGHGYRKGGIVRAFEEIADGLGRLVSEHVLLAKLELAQDAHVISAEVGKIAAFAPLVVVGYALVCAGIALELARWISQPAALGIVGAVNLAVGGVGLYGAARRLKVQRPLEQTLREASQSAVILTPATGQTIEVRHGP